MNKIFFKTTLIFNKLEINSECEVAITLKNGETLVGRVEESPFDNELFLIREVKNLDLTTGGATVEQPESIEMRDVLDIKIKQSNGSVINE